LKSSEESGMLRPDGGLPHHQQQEQGCAVVNSGLNMTSSIAPDAAKAKNFKSSLLNSP
jgi:hypothetical protein